MAKNNKTIWIIGAIVAVILILSQMDTGLFAAAAGDSSSNYKAKILGVQNPAHPAYANYIYMVPSQTKQFEIKFSITDPKYKATNPTIVCESSSPLIKFGPTNIAATFSDGTRHKPDIPTSSQLMLNTGNSIAFTYPGKLDSTKGVLKFSSAVRYEGSTDAGPGFVVCQLFVGSKAISQGPKYLYIINEEAYKNIQGKY